MDQRSETRHEITGRVEYDVRGDAYINGQDFAEWIARWFPDGQKVKITVESE